MTTVFKGRLNIIFLLWKTYEEEEILRSKDMPLLNIYFCAGLTLKEKDGNNAALKQELEAELLLWETCVEEEMIKQKRPNILVCFRAGLTDTVNQKEGKNAILLLSTEGRTAAVGDV